MSVGGKGKITINHDNACSYANLSYLQFPLSLWQRFCYPAKGRFKHSIQILVSAFIVLIINDYEISLVYRYQSNNKYKLVKIFQQERAQQITCFSAINGFHSCILYLVCLLFFALTSNDYMKDCNIVLMILSYFLFPGTELERTLGTGLEEPHQALARKIITFLCVVTSSSVACNSKVYQEILKELFSSSFPWWLCRYSFVLRL